MNRYPKRCGHCEQELKGMASIGNIKVCHPDYGMDCYKLTTVYNHSIPCQCCSEANLLLRNSERVFQ